MRGHHAGAPVAARVRHVEALLEDRGLLDDGEIDRRIDAFLAGGSPLNGARIAARAWVDPGFRRRLLDDANTAIGELGLSMGGGLQEQRLKVVANTEDEHNVVVCTLCSCYPHDLLGNPPWWYRTDEYRQRMVADPRKALRDMFDLEVPDGVTVKVYDSTSDVRWMVLPRRPEGTEGMTEEQLAELVTSESLVGTALARSVQPAS